MKRWILSAPVLSGQGTWTYWLIDRDMAAYWLSLHARDATSRVGYEAAEHVAELAEHVAELAGIPGWLPVLTREPSVLEVDDEALVVRMTYRVPDQDAKDSRAPQAWEYGILKRLTKV